MEILILIIAGMVISFCVLYYIIKAAVRDAILEARYADDFPNSASDDKSGISQITCAKCGKEYDMDYPKCPYCKHQN